MTKPSLPNKAERRLTQDAWGRYDAAAEKTTCVDTSLRSPEKHDFYSECAERITTHRPIAQQSTPDQVSKISKEVFTPGGTKLYLKGIYGTLAVYGDASNEQQTITNASFFTLFLTHLADHVTIHGVVPPPLDAIKTQTAEIDVEQLEKVQHTTGGYRRISQNKAMSSDSPHRTPLTTHTVKDVLFEPERISALVEELNLPDDISADIFTWVEKLTPEWLHLIDHASWGDRAQSHANLVYGSRECNTHMMVVEAFIKAWLEKYPDCKVTINVIAKLIPNSHLCEKIDYEVTTDNGLKKSFTFYPLNTERPLLQAPSYLYYASHFSSRLQRSHTALTLAQAAMPLTSADDNSIVSDELSDLAAAADTENQFPRLRCQRKLHL